MLRTIAGLEQIGGGEIAIGGQVVNNMRPRDRNIAMVFQNYALYPYLTVFENVAFGLRARKVPSPEINKRVQDAADMLGDYYRLSGFGSEQSSPHRGGRVLRACAAQRDCRCAPGRAGRCDPGA